MTHFINQLIQRINQFRLDQKMPSQLPSQIDWRQILILAENEMLSDPMAKTLYAAIDQDIDFLKDYPDFLHRLPEPQQWYADGLPEIELGSLMGAEDLRFGVRFDRPIFILVSGITGYGKTAAVRVLLQAIHGYNLKHPDKKKVVIVFDRKGADYADLAPRFGWKHFHIRHTLRLALDPPKGMLPKVWINIVANRFCARAGLKFSWSTFVAAFQTLMGLLNPDPSLPLIAPDPKAILDLLRTLPDKTFGSKNIYTQSLCQQLEALVYSGQETFHAFRGLAIEEYVEQGQSMIISMPTMEPSWPRQFIVDLLMDRISKPRQENFYQSDTIKVLFVVDEADDDVNAETEKLFGGAMCTESEVFKKGREIGLGAVVIVSSLVGVSKIIRENATMHIVVRTDDAKAKSEVATTLSLPPYGELSLGYLDRAECLLKQIGPWPHAVKGKIDKMPPSRVKITQFDRHSFIPAQNIFTIEAVKQFINRVRAKSNDASPKEPQEDATEKLALQVLQKWIEAPYTPLARLFDLMGKIHHRTRLEICQFLKDQELAEVEETRAGRTNLLLLEAAPKAYSLFHKPIPQGNQGRGKVVHRHFVRWIQKNLEQQGFTTYLEWTVPGSNHPVDLGVSFGNHWHVYEICVTSVENVVSHVENCFQCPDITKLIFVAPTKTQLKEIKEKINNSIIGLTCSKQIGYESIESYIPKGPLS